MRHPSKYRSLWFVSLVSFFGSNVIGIDRNLETQVLSVFENHCAECHREEEPPFLHQETDLVELAKSGDVGAIVNRIQLSLAANRRMPRSRGEEGDESYRTPLTPEQITLIEQWAAEAAPAGAVTEEEETLLPGHNTHCPIDTTQPVNPKLKLTYAGKTVYFCCNHCKDLFQVHANYVIKARGKHMPQFTGMEEELGLDVIQLLPQRFCPVYDRMLILPGCPSVEFQGKTVYFHEETAMNVWKRDPEKHAGKLDSVFPEASTGTIEAASTSSEALPEGSLEVQARHILNKHCHRCHNPQKRRSPDLEAPLSVMLELEDHRSILERVHLPADHDDVMPPLGNQSRVLNSEEIEVLEKWFASGVKEIEKRDRIDFSEAIQAIYDDVGKHEIRARHFRYLTLTNLYNATDSEGIPLYDEHRLETFRVALSKLINSLSMHGKITVPQAIDNHRTVFRIDLRDYSWSHEDWERVVSYYPHGIVGIDGRRERIIFETTRSRMPYVRGDWFAFAASQPPLYDDIMDYLLGIYEAGHAGVQTRLEQRLAVDRVYNLQTGNAVRAGFIHSGVSDHNRLIERHESTYGAYWVSYDFQRTAGGSHQDIRQAPLGPPEARITGNDRYVFHHDGGEMIYSLPNGLQGYLLATADGTRLDRAPIGIVRDKNRPDGTIINGISCIKCHEAGIKGAEHVRFPSGMVQWDEEKMGEPSPRTPAGMTDEIRPFMEQSRILGGSDFAIFEKLYPGKETLRSLVLQDCERFNRALSAAIGDHVSEIEPVSALYNAYYLNPINSRVLSSDFGMDHDEMMSILERESFQSDSFRTLYLSLANGTAGHRDQMMQEYLSIIYALGYQVVPFEPLGYEEFGGEAYADLIRESPIYQAVCGRTDGERFTYGSIVTPERREITRNQVTSSPLAMDRQSRNAVLLPGGGRMEVEVTPAIQVGDHGSLKVTSNRTIFLNILHRGSGVGVTQFFPNDNLRDDEILSSGDWVTKTITFSTSPPAGAEYFEVYASNAPISIDRQGEKAGPFRTFDQGQIFNARGIATAMSATDTSGKKSDIQPWITKAQVGYLLNP